VGNSVTDTLLQLCDLDAQLHVLDQQRIELTSERDTLAADLNFKRRRLAELENAHKEGRLKQVMEQHRLRDENEKIVNRRKQLTAVGGAKVAKYVEREIDIASRSLEAMEASAIRALQEVDQLEGQLQPQRTDVEKLELEFEGFSQQATEKLTSLEKELKSLAKDRDNATLLVDERLLRLYNRVRTRYPAEAVARALEGACQSCSRALPSQTYNQILAGNLLIQCPGCSRILVSVAQ